MHAFTFHRQTEPETQEISRAAEVFQTTLQVLKNRVKQRYKRDYRVTELLSGADLDLITELSECPSALHPVSCQPSHLSKYRTITGVCNNRQNPRWGAANTALVRWLPAEYEDGEKEPKGWNRERLYNGFQLPLPRTLSREIVRSACKSNDEAYSQLLVHWGQYIDHDITMTPQNSASPVRTGKDCSNSCKNVEPCFPIQTQDACCDAQGCIPFFRSTPDCFVNPQYDTQQALQRQQLNAISSFIDAALIYGSTPHLQSFLRGPNGKLAVNNAVRDPKKRPYLPYMPMLPTSCLQNLQEPHWDRVECFIAGDVRVNEGLPLTILHTLFLREHNRIAEELKHINNHWNAETIFQETRKIIGAVHQIITMRDYLPKIIGSESFQEFIGPYRGYDPTVNPSAANVFATAAFRFGHGTVSPILPRLNESFQEHERFCHLRMHATFFSPWRIVNEGGIEPILRGMIGSAASVASSKMLVAEEVTERLILMNSVERMDLASMNMQRGRDHGLPGYNDWRKFCGLRRVRTLKDLAEVVGDYRVAEKVLNIYKHVDNIDVWLGGLLESLLPGARTGPLFACLIGKQMKMIRDGDRFWWSAEGIFTQQQKNELLQFSLSRLICDNSDVGEVLPDSFQRGTYPCDYVSCDHIPSMNLEAWREKRLDLQQCAYPGTIKNGDFVLSTTSGKLVALYSCSHGFKLKGSAAIVCEGGRWNGQPPQCT
ncbi:thyroid peroxidase, partial [Stegastes partitus]|uniref:Thyroid peroxidase n=1 Tax=Stegastes partitus TaxID=144197 RepID=A0A9Y4JR98_9TELE